MQIEKEIIDYEQNKEDIEHWVTLKGEYRYEEIIEFMKKENIKCTWENVTNYVRYDKRILINSFKYIVFLEELFKSFVHKYKNGNVIEQDFKICLNHFISLDEKAKYDEIDINLLSKEKKSINNYRNCVVHNKILIGKSFIGKSLEQILEIYKNILPKSYRSGFIKDINNCAKGLLEGTYHIKI